MQKVELGIKKERQYLIDRQNGLDYSLAEEMKKIGYNNLESFFNEKREYSVEKLTFQKRISKVDVCIDVLKEMISEGNPSVLIVPSDRLFVYHGDEEYDQEYCKKNNIPVYEIGHHGGNIVGGPKDISIGILLPKDLGLNNNWYLKHYQQIFQQNGIVTEIDNNDLIWQGTKIMGCALLNYDTVNLHVSNFSFSDVTEEISQICKVERVKQPGSLDKVIDRSVIQVGVEQWLKL